MSEPPSSQELANMTGCPAQLWRDAELTLGPYWPQLWEQVLHGCVKINATPASIARMYIGAMREHSS